VAFVSFFFLETGRPFPSGLFVSLTPFPLAPYSFFVFHPVPRVRRPRPSYLLVPFSGKFGNPAFLLFGFFWFFSPARFELFCLFLSGGDCQDRPPICGLEAAEFRIAICSSFLTSAIKPLKTLSFHPFSEFF